MSNTTTNYGFPKPSYTDFGDVATLDSAFDQIDTALKAIENRALITQTAIGTGTVITLTLPTLVNGYTFTFIASANNNGAATTINGKQIYKAGTTTPPTFVAGKAYTAWYDSANDCFFIKASAEGNTIADHVLAGDTFSNNNDTGLVGSMPNNGSVSPSLPINGIYPIPKGYHDGTGRVTQNITTKGTQTYTPTTYDQTIPANQYISGAQTVKGDSNLIASNIISGKSIFGVNGSATIQSLGGTKMYYKSGNTTTSSTNINTWCIDLSGLPFDPKIINGTVNWNGTIYYFSQIRGLSVNMETLYNIGSGSGYKAYGSSNLNKLEVLQDNGITVSNDHPLSVTYEAWGWE